MSEILTEVTATPTEWTEQNPNFAASKRILDIAQSGNTSLIFMIGIDPAGATASSLALYSTVDFGITVLKHEVPAGLTSANFSFKGLAVVGDVVFVGNDAATGGFKAAFDGSTPIQAADWTVVTFAGPSGAVDKYGVYNINNTLVSPTDEGMFVTPSLGTVTSVPRTIINTLYDAGGGLVILDSGVAYMTTGDHVFKSVDEGLTWATIGSFSIVPAAAQGDARRATVTSTQAVMCTRPVSGNSTVYYRLLETGSTSNFASFTFPFGLIQSMGYSPITDRLYVCTLNGANIEMYYATANLGSGSAIGTFWTKDMRLSAPDNVASIPDVYLPIRGVTPPAGV